MPKKLFKRFIPTPEAFKDSKHLGPLARLLDDPNMFHLNRRSAAGALGVGLFVAFLPIPFQMALAGLLAAMLRVNLPLAVAAVWTSNPVTMPAMFYFAYWVGVQVLGVPEKEFSFELSWSWLQQSFVQLGPAFMTGCLICGFVFGMLGYFIVRYLWRWMVIRNWRKRVRLYYHD